MSEAIRPLSADEIHELACDVDHDLRESRLSLIRWTNQCVAMLLATVGAERAAREAAEKERDELRKLLILILRDEPDGKRTIIYRV